MPRAEVVITLTAKTDLVRKGEPVTRGVPWPKGMLNHPSDLRMFDEDDNAIPLQTEILDRWSDGSVRWVLCDWQAEFPKHRKYRLRLDPGFPVVSVDNLVPVCVDRTASLVWEMNPGQIVSWVQGEASVWMQGGPRRWFTTHVENPQGIGPFQVGLRHTCYAGSQVVRYDITIRNSMPADHPGGCWDLGRSPAYEFDFLNLKIPFMSAFSAKLSPEPGIVPREVSLAARLLQESSGGENWNSTNHLNGERIVDPRFRGYRITSQDTLTGLQACPIAILRNTAEEIAVSYPDFWQNFPKGLHLALDGIRFELFPHREGRKYELQGGEQKTHTFYVSFGKDTITESPLEWTRDPLVPVVDPEWIASTKAIPYLTPRAKDVHRDYLGFVDSAIEGDDCFEKKRQVIDEYGWRHFGDLYGDHEAVLHPDFPPTPRVSHYNNQYDAVAGFGYQFLRSGDPRWLTNMRELAQHVIDIDIYHTNGDKSAYNHGLFWHTYHYVDADTGTHRSYPKQGKVPPHGKPVPGGGPSNEHNYATGLMLHYFLTGDLAAKEAALGLAQWVIDMDDGNKTIFRWLSRGFTGLASQSRSPDYHGPGRGSANSVSVLLDGHRLTGEKKYLDKAEQIIRRVIHPKEDVASRNLLDAENRWFYTMFLQSLGKYLDYQVERGDLGFMYAYARECLLVYARWMRANEYPYLQRKAILEYPTETWAAQDLRKGEIFHFATMHAAGDEREEFRRAASFFFHIPITQLSTMPSRTLCRPLVLMLSYGWMHNYFRLNPEEARPAPKGNHDFGEPERFIPQKRIAKKRAKRLAAGMLGLAILGVLWLVLK